VDAHWDIDFMNYLYFSKHLHILLAFPNTYFADLNPLGEFDNLEAVTKSKNDDGS
jgi:hypothetical protein